MTFLEFLHMQILEKSAKFINKDILVYDKNYYIYQYFKELY